MSSQGKELGADLYRLLVAGKDSLPSVAAVYAEAKSKLDSSMAQAATAMRTPDHFGGPGRVHAAWTELGNSLSRVVAETQDSLDDTGRALLLAVERYAATDSEAAAELARLRREVREPQPGQR